MILLAAVCAHLATEDIKLERLWLLLCHADASKLEARI